MDIIFVCNNAAVCGGRRGLKICVKDSSIMWKSLDRKSDVMFEAPFMCWECSDTLLLIRVHTNQIETVLWVTLVLGQMTPCKSMIGNLSCT